MSARSRDMGEVVKLMNAGERRAERHLNCGQCVEQMGVVGDIPAEATAGMPAIQDETYHFIAIHVLGAAHDFHGRKTWRNDYGSQL